MASCKQLGRDRYGIDLTGSLANVAVVTMNQACVEPHIRSQTCWNDLPDVLKQQLGNSQKEYDKAILAFSTRNQLRFKGNLGKTTRHDITRMYQNLMLFILL